MRITSLELKIIEKLNYKTVLPLGDKPCNIELPFIKGEISGLPDDLDAIIVTSDLQGLVVDNGKEELLGEVLPEFLKLFLEVEFPDLKPEKIGIFLCGDFFATLTKRGGLGDVRNVWNKFNLNFKWVAGISGNHDSFGTTIEFEKLKSSEGIYYITKETIKIGNLKISGISGIIGKPEKPNRIMEEEYLKLLEKLLSKEPDVLLLHQTPDFPALNLRGNSKIRDILEKCESTLVFCGHNHWQHPLVDLKNKTQILNADSRVIILINKKV